MTITHLPPPQPPHYVYRHTPFHSAPTSQWTVGHFTERGDFIAHSPASTLHEAQCITARLNGLPQPAETRRCDKTIDIFHRACDADAQARARFESECG